MVPFLGSAGPSDPRTPDEADEAEGPAGTLHDLNNVFSVILASAEWLAARLSPDSELVEDARAIVAAAKRGAALTHRLRTEAQGALGAEAQAQEAETKAPEAKEAERGPAGQNDEGGHER